jgi:hypothetical protein
MMHDMSNLRKEIAARLGFAAKGSKAKFTLEDVLLDAMDAVKNNEPHAAMYVNQATKSMMRYQQEMTADDRDWIRYKKLISLANRKGVQIETPMTLRASRPGAKAKFALDHAAVSKALNTLYEDAEDAHGLTMNRDDDLGDIVDQADEYASRLARDQGNQALLTEVTKWMEKAKKVLAKKMRELASRPGAKAKMAAPRWEDFFPSEGKELLTEAENLQRKIADKSRELFETTRSLQIAVSTLKTALQSQDAAAYTRARQMIYNADRARSSFSRPGAKAPTRKAN